MLDASSIPSFARPCIGGSIRKAEPRDTAELARLVAATLVDPAVTPLDDDRGHLLVLDLDGSLRAVAYVVIDALRSRARLHLLVVDGTLGASARAVEDRMFGVALALCNAYGCPEVDVVAGSRTLAAAGATIDVGRAIRVAG